MRLDDTGSSGVYSQNRQLEAALAEQRLSVLIEGLEAEVGCNVKSIAVDDAMFKEVSSEDRSVVLLGN